MKKDGYILAVDPDIEASGIAVLDCRLKRFVMVQTMSFASLARLLESLSMTNTTIVIEDSDMSANWHYGKAMSKAAVAAIGRKVGLCHAVGRMAAEVAQANGLAVVRQRPLVKCWKGKDRKISHDEAKQFMTGLPNRTNPEMRDAALLAWHFAGYPIRLKI